MEVLKAILVPVWQCLSCTSSLPDDDCAWRVLAVTIFIICLSPFCWPLLKRAKLRYMDSAFGTCAILAAFCLFHTLRYPDAEAIVYGYTMWFLSVFIWDEEAKNEVKLSLGKRRNDNVSYDIEIDEIVRMATPVGNEIEKRMLKRARTYGEITVWVFGLVFIFGVMFLWCFLGKLLLTEQKPSMVSIGLFRMLFLMLPPTFWKLCEKLRRRKLLKLAQQVAAHMEANKRKEANHADAG